jgi:hypothetical protein
VSESVDKDAASEVTRQLFPIRQYCMNYRLSRGYFATAADHKTVPAVGVGEVVHFKMSCIFLLACLSRSKFLCMSMYWVCVTGSFVTKENEYSIGFVEAGMEES